jgi:hypothetical protein
MLIQAVTEWEDIHEEFGAQLKPAPHMLHD